MENISSDYKIISFNKDLGTIIIEWQYDLKTHEIVIPIEDGNYIIGESLDFYIKGFFPIRYHERIEQIKNGIFNEDLINILVEPIIIPVTQSDDILTTN
jgi:hypothetical protein